MSRRRRGMALRRRLLIVGTPAAAVLPLTYLLNDEFSTDEAAPLASPRTAEPGPGSWTLTQTGGTFSISGGIETASLSGANWTDLRAVAGDTFTRVAGLGFYSRWRATDLTGDFPLPFLLSNTATPTITGYVDTYHGIYVDATGFYAIANQQGIKVGSYIVNTYEDTAVVLKSSGAYTFRKISSVWCLVWVSYSETITPLYFLRLPYAKVINWGAQNVATLPAFADTSFLTFNQTGALSAGTGFTHPANGWINNTLTTRPSASNTDFRFRIQDASNYWQRTINSSGDIILNEVVAGVPTARGTKLATAASGDLDRILLNGNVITGWSQAGATVTQSWSHTSGGNFATATTGEVTSLGTGGAISDLQTMPYNPTGDHSTQLDQIAAGT